MNKLTLLVLALGFCALMLAGCSTASRPGCCGCMEGNRCGWDFYRPGDLVEGRAMNCCGGDQDPCQRPCKQGVVVSQCYAVPVEKKAPAVETPEEAAGAAAAAGEDVAEFGPPADER